MESKAMMKGEDNSSRWTAAPERILDEFRAICRIPHGSGYEREIGEHLKERLTSFGGEVYKDEAGNILGVFLGNSGNLNSSYIMLQAHMDMVIAGDKSPEEAVVNPVIKEGAVRSDGHTSLGADNGIGIATILTIVSELKEDHGPLKVLFTVSEEIGLKGAKAVPESWLKNVKYMINTDGFHSDTEVVGCKGGLRETFFRPLEMERFGSRRSFNGSGYGSGDGLRDDSNYKSNGDLNDGSDDFWELYDVRLEDFLGGHSGDDIDKHRCNSIHQLAEILKDVQEITDMAVQYISGGAAYNAIPSECTSLVAIPKVHRISIGKLLKLEEGRIHNEYEKTDEAGRLRVRHLREVSPEDMFWTHDFQRDTIHFLSCLQDGINSLNNEKEVSSSSNLGMVYSKEDNLYIGDMIRCDTLDQEEDILSSHKKVAEESGFKINVTGYHSWHGREDGLLAELISKIYEEHQGLPMRRKVAKVGLEPAFFQELAPEMEIVCLGAEIKNAHSVQEEVAIASIDVLYNLIFETLIKIWEGDESFVV